MPDTTRGRRGDVGDRIVMAVPACLGDAKRWQQEPGGRSTVRSDGSIWEMLRDMFEHVHSWPATRVVAIAVPVNG